MKAEVLLLIFCCAYAWDQILGEYPQAVHPVVWMGACIDAGRRLLLGRGPRLEFWGGFVLLGVIAGGFAAAVAAALAFLQPWPWLQAAVGCYFLKASFALKALGFAAIDLGRHLRSGDTEAARAALRSLCSRDPKELDEEQLLEATISSLAENLSDSFIAPLFYFLIAGIPGAIFYRAVNTLDAMVGYKNHLKHLGYASARCDDLLNWIPARLTTLLLLGIAWAAHYPWRYATQIAWRDHRKTPSPNGGWPMACMAGLLQIQLRKPQVYTLGQALQKSELQHLNRAWYVSLRAGHLAFALSLIVLIIRARESLP